MHVRSTELHVSCSLTPCQTSTSACPRSHEFSEPVRSSLQVTVAHIAPPVALFMAKHPMVSAFDMRALRTLTSAAAPLSADASRELAARLDHPDLKITQGQSSRSHQAPNITSPIFESFEPMSAPSHISLPHSPVAVESSNVCKYVVRVFCVAHETLQENQCSKDDIGHPETMSSLRTGRRQFKHEHLDRRHFGSLCHPQLTD